MVLVAIGHSPVCPLGRAVKSAEHRALLTEAKDRILRNSRLERTDEQHGLELWSTPKGKFWIPVKNQYVLPFNLAEMERKVYGSGEHFISAWRHRTGLRRERRRLHARRAPGRSEKGSRDRTGTAEYRVPAAQPWERNLRRARGGLPEGCVGQGRPDHVERERR